MAGASGKSERDLGEDIIREAFAIIESTGLESLSMREVARRLGVSHQAPYKHFESREHILAELIRRALATLAERMEARERFEDPYLDLMSMGRFYMAYATANALNYRLTFGAALIDPHGYPGVKEQGERAFAILAEAVGRLPAHAGAPVAAQAVALDCLFTWATCHGLVSLMQSAALKSLGMPVDNPALLHEHVMTRVLEAHKAFAAAVAGRDGRPTSAGDSGPT